MHNHGFLFMTLSVDTIAHGNNKEDRYAPSGRFMMQTSYVSISQSFSFKITGTPQQTYTHTVVQLEAIFTASVSDTY